MIGPDSNEFVQMMRTENRRVSSQIVEVVHDDGHEQVQHLMCGHCCVCVKTLYSICIYIAYQEWRQEDETRKIYIAESVATGVALVAIEDIRTGQSALLASRAGHHYVLPAFACCTSKIGRIYTHGEMPQGLCYRKRRMSELKNDWKLLCRLISVAAFSQMLPKTCIPTIA